MRTSSVTAGSRLPVGGKFRKRACPILLSWTVGTGSKPGPPATSKILIANKIRDALALDNTLARYRAHSGSSAYVDTDTPGRATTRPDQRPSHHSYRTIRDQNEFPMCQHILLRPCRGIGGLHCILGGPRSSPRCTSRRPMMLVRAATRPLATHLGPEYPSPERMKILRPNPSDALGTLKR